MTPVRLSLALVTGMFIVHSGASLTAYVHPARLTVGLTDTMTVRCSFTRDNILTPLSIALAQSRDSVHSFDDMASISFFSGLQVTEMVGGNAQADGTVQVNGTSYLEVKWTLPTTRVSGEYKCSLTGLDRSGNVVKEIKIVTVRETSPTDLNFIAVQEKLLTTSQKLLKLEEKYSEIENRMSKFNDSLNSKIKDILNAELPGKFTELTNNITLNLDKKLYRMEGNLQNINESNRISTSQNSRSVDIMFSQILSFRNSTYYLSRYSVARLSAGQIACAVFGGYVVEIDSLEEYSAIVSAFKSDIKYTGVLIGLTDEKTEGHWFYTYSRVPARFTLFNTGEPNGGEAENCVLLYPDYGWKMLDIKCNDHNLNYPRHFLCEVPK